jgi:HEAT repeat protein
MSLVRDLGFMRLIKYSSVFDSNKKIFSNDLVLYLLKALESSEYPLSADIENDLVKLGKKAIKPLVRVLESPNTKVRSYAAMALIRIGSDIVEPLKKEFEGKEEYQWMVDFIVSEINGSSEPLANGNFFKSIAS